MITVVYAHPPPLCVLFCLFTNNNSCHPTCARRTTLATRSQTCTPPPAAFSLSSSLPDLMIIADSRTWASCTPARMTTLT
ncbi:hypothetical protein K461DRAFT_74067 [Myriangium duriaei CBS 260.36]|uniref:Uncharacterized protein n=1 Tax=Myriangium duriaei CBS 260.36 TaxID=1168546 RepID=A0A9P4IVZ8_9PEZI|nr:hypothetical protein K461DRAFT_74067 [Myriangium duriaei CBS 260.36]